MSARTSMTTCSPDPVEHGLTRIGLQRALAPNFEAPDSLKCLEDGFLHEILGFGQIAGPARQPAGGPPAKAGQPARGQQVDGLGVAVAGAFQQDASGLRSAVPGCGREEPARSGMA
jgi:hypothetical protein